MTKAQHTPGPWTHEGQGDITGIENDPSIGCVGKVDVACVYLRTVPGRTEANARLIAAAPEMLAALKLAASHMHCLKDARAKADYSMARAAIAKVKG